MTTTKRSRILTLFMMLSLLFQATAVAQDVGSSPGVDGALNVRLQDTDGTTLDGCVTVQDANGASHHDCTRDAGGWIVFTGLPYGMATVTNVQTEAGYYQAPAQDVVIIENGAPTVTMVSEPVVVAPAMASLSLDEGDGEAEVESDPVVTPEENGAPEDTGEGVGGGDTGEEGNAGGENGEAETEDEGDGVQNGEGNADGDDNGAETGGDDEVADPEDGDEGNGVAEDDETDADPDEVNAQSTPAQRLIRPFADGTTANFQCVPGDLDQPSALTLFIPFDEDSGPAPSVTKVMTDRFGDVTNEPVQLTWTNDHGEPAQSGYLYATNTEPSIWVDFEINADGYEYEVGGRCSSYSPFELTITTVAVREDGTEIPNGGQVGSTTPFRDTAEFQGEHLDKLAGQQVTYYLYKGDACSGTPVFSEIVTIGEGGAIPPSGLFDPTDFDDGVYNWQVVYEGDVQEPDPETNFRGNFRSAESECGSERVIVGSYETEIETVMQTAGDATIPHGGEVTIGTTVRDTTILTPTGQPSGTLTYTLYHGDSCDGEPVFAPESIVFANGEVPASPDFTPTALGTYHWVVEFESSDDTYTDATSPCGSETFTVVQASPSITTVMMDGETPLSNNATVDRGTEVHDTATLENFYIPEGGSLGGTVTYTLVHGNCPDGTVVAETDELPVGSTIEDGKLILPEAPAYTVGSAGTYNWIVTYSGDEFNEPDTSGCGEETFEVEKNTPAISTIPQHLIGEDDWQDIDENGVIQATATVRDTAVVSGLAGEEPSGDVTFRLYRGAGCGGNPIASVDGEIGEDGYLNVISGIVEDLGPGRYNWVVTYAGDDENNSVTTDCFEEQFFVTEGTGVTGYVHTVVMNADTDQPVPNGGSVPLGTTVYDTAQFYGDIRDGNGNAAINGTLTYTLYDGDACEGEGLRSWEFDVAANEPVPAIPAEDAFQFENAGLYNFQAVFTSDEGDDAVRIASPCGTEAVNVAAAQPTITTKMHLGSDENAPVISHGGRITRPATVSDSVEVTYSDQDLLDGVPGPNGRLTYTLHNTGDCSDDRIDAGSFDVVNGEFTASNAIDLSETDYGTYNWVVEFESSDGNYNDAVSGCGSETFHLDATPTLSTTMYSSAAGEGTGGVLEDGEKVLVGEFVRDTATLTGATDDASGTVTFTLYQGLTCSGEVMYSETVDVDNGDVESTGWFQVPLYGEYSWEAVYSGDNTSGGYNEGFTHCDEETFFAEQNPDITPSMVTVMRQGESPIPHGSFIVEGAEVTDQAVFTNLSDEATGTVTYELYANANCTGDAVFTDTQDVENGLAPRSLPYTVPALSPTQNSLVYSWVVTFEGKNHEYGDTFILESGCGEEQFRLFSTPDYRVQALCTYHGNDDTMSLTLTLSPRDVDNTGDPADVTIQPYNRDLSPADPITLTGVTNYIITGGPDGEFSHMPWRMVTGDVTWNPGTDQEYGAEFSVRCVNRKYEPQITTAMFIEGQEGELPNGGQVAPGTKIYDTARVQENTSTYQLSGTLTYTLYKGNVCDVAGSTAVPGGTTTHTLDGVKPSELPNSDPVTVQDEGTYFWVVTFTPASGQFGSDNNTNAVSNCRTESFTVSPDPQNTVLPVEPTVTQAFCTEENAPVYPTVTLPANTGDIEYTKSGDEVPGGTVIVTATLKGDVVWNTAIWPEGWIDNGDGTATFTVELEDVECAPVRPVAPTVEQSTCTAPGESSDPSVTLPADTADIEYTKSGEEIPGGTVIVTATIVSDRVWDELDGTGWIVNPENEREATYTIELDDPDCTVPVIPVAPTSADGVCEGGQYTPPTITTSDEPEGVSYDVSDIDSDGNYTVTATLAEGYAWDEDSSDWPTDEWTVNEDGTATYSGSVELNECEPVIPEIPTVDGNVCSGGTYTEPTVNVPEASAQFDYELTQDIDENGDYVVTATIKDGFSFGDLTDTGWTDNDDGTATYNGHEDLQPCDEIAPVNPTVSGNVCEGGAYTDPQIDLPTTPEGVSYEVAQDVDENGDYVVTATLSDGQAWAEDLGDWTRTSDTVATYEGHEDLTPCDPVLPIQPEVTQVACTGGELTDPVVSTTDTEAITYTFNEDDVVNGGTVEITATLADGYEWDTDANDWPEGWTVVEDNPAQATRIVELDEVSCTPVTPVNPTVTNTVCTGGELTEPTVTPAETDGIEYTTEGDVVNGGTVIVIATLEDGYGWPEVLPAGWTDNEDGTASFTVELDDVSCDPVTPIIPEVTQAVCEGGELIPPTITPVETEGIEYTFDEGQVAPGATVIVTATVQDGYGWPETLPDGWERVNSETATTEVNLEDVECEEVIPAAPVVENAVCTEGALTEPTVTLQETNGIEYTTEGDVVNGGTVIVTATVQDGYAWAETLPAGWTKVDSETATYTVELDEVNCTPVTPVAPTVNNAVCTGGALTEPTVTPAETEGIEYTFDQDDVINGGTVVITATVEDGYGWPETLPAGWTKIDDATATWTVELDEVSCTPVTPETPETTQPVCTEGVVQDGFVTVPPTEGVEYTIEGDIVPGGTVVITGTVQDGYAWPSELPGGWTKIDDATVTYTIQLDEVECTEVDPGLPVITQPVCTEDGTVQDPTISLPETPGVDYTIEGELVPGGTVVITATLKDGYAWPVDILEGWTRVDDTTMTFSVTFDTVDCETPADPSDPEDPAATPEPGSPVETLPSTGSGGAAMSTAGMAVLLLATMAAITAAVAAWLRREGAR